MKIQKYSEGRITILAISVNMLGDSQASFLHDHVKDLISQDKSTIILDLKEVRAVNSIGLGILMACWSSLNKAGGELILSNVSDKINDILILTDLDQFFKEYENTKKAIASLLSDA
jgi:anti-sigma B factor antagonist